ncbi:hypothetical protein PCC7424_5243 [Gloeothece citriformis PCC 7424]|uniref:Uncharacterized protein n=1 Tax=Gloeothece citriformis (strain PCC 7424) TaxID=65393 RepID=B7KIA4_GLOC7|nr:hypothetical protein [Gloeothece citriformis]ACK73591.1 hypothetical protein PCC7424_5243 [Gloeothece citriformis PCC 7424]
MKLLPDFIGFSTAIAVYVMSGLIPVISAQTATFTYEEVTYTVDLKKSKNQTLAFSLSYPDSEGNMSIVEYQGTCGENTIGVLGQKVVNSQGQVISENTAAQPIIFDISPNNRDWEMSGAIRQALELMCNSME